MLVKELMSTLEHVVSPNDSLDHVLEIMHLNTLSCVLVCNEEAPVGIVTERDMVRAFYNQRKNGEDDSLADIMTDDPVCVLEETPLEDALTLARSRNIRHIPVVNSQDKVVGIVTQTDMHKAFLQSLEHSAKLEQANKELETLTLEDPLLNIGNRRCMEVELEFTESSAKRYQKPYSVALMDVDYFKKYNDCYGHQAGDDALKRIAKLIQGCIRKSDRLYRYGGEELLLLMPNTKSEGALASAERIQTLLFQQQLPHELSPLKFLSISIGVVTSSNLSWKDMVKRADQALYQAKDDGRNRVTQASSDGFSAVHAMS